jgi:hypothetical protein
MNLGGRSLQILSPEVMSRPNIWRGFHDQNSITDRICDLSLGSGI